MGAAAAPKSWPLAASSPRHGPWRWPSAGGWLRRAPQASPPHGDCHAPGGRVQTPGVPLAGEGGGRRREWRAACGGLGPHCSPHPPRPAGLAGRLGGRCSEPGLGGPRSACGGRGGRRKPPQVSGSHPSLCSHATCCSLCECQGTGVSPHPRVLWEPGQSGSPEHGPGESPPGCGDTDIDPFAWKQKQGSVSHPRRALQAGAAPRDARAQRRPSACEAKRAQLPKPRILRWSVESSSFCRVDDSFSLLFSVFVLDLP